MTTVHHYSQLKLLAKSGKEYVHGCATPFEPTSAMLIGTAVHEILLGCRPGKGLAIFPGKARKGAEWDRYRACFPGQEIVTDPEWEKANRIVDAVRANPIAMERMHGARFEVPLEWEDDGLQFATGGVDILGPQGMYDLKTTASCEPHWLERQAFKMFYHCQLAFYARGMRRLLMPPPARMGLICVESKAPHDVVVLDMTPRLIELGEQTVSVWLERLQAYQYLKPAEWPGYAQAALEWDVPAWVQDDDETELEEAA